jgi:nucleoside-diphosphate kinase
MLIKPDAMASGQIGNILNRVEEAGFEIEAMVAEVPNRMFMEIFYQEHRSKPFFEQQVEFMCSGVVCAVLLRRDDAVDALLELVGATVPAEAAPGTLRYEFGDRINGLPRNAVHASASEYYAECEIELVFDEHGTGLHYEIQRPEPGMQRGKWDKPKDMIVYVVGSKVPEGEVVVAHLRLDCAIKDMKERRRKCLWLCRGRVLGVPRLLPTPKSEDHFWKTEMPWRGKWMAASTGVWIPPFDGMVACSSVEPIQRLDDLTSLIS